MSAWLLPSSWWRFKWKQFSMFSVYSRKKNLTCLRPPLATRWRLLRVSDEMSPIKTLGSVESANHSSLSSSIDCLEFKQNFTIHHVSEKQQKGMEKQALMMAMAPQFLETYKRVSHWQTLWKFASSGWWCFRRDSVRNNSVVLDAIIGALLLVNGQQIKCSGKWAEF